MEFFIKLRQFLVLKE